MLIAAFALMANATPPPAPPAGVSGSAGWGMCPENWENHTGDFYAWGLWDPGINDWQVYGPAPGYAPLGPIAYEDITLELWIELIGIQSYEFTSYQWHFAEIPTGGTTVDFYISGTIACNEYCIGGLEYAGEDLGLLHYQHGMYSAGSDIALNWECRGGNGSTIGADQVWPTPTTWAPLTPDPNLYLPWTFPPCDHWFQYHGWFWLAYHIQDGYYTLTIGSCPTPEV